VLRLDELVARADRIYMGRVRAVRCLWLEEETNIVTEVTFAVHDRFKGPRRRELTIRVPGGQLPGRGVALEVTHQPRFARGDEGVLFLEDAPGRWSPVAGAEQGFMKLRAGSAPGRRRLVDGFGRAVHGLDAEHRLLTDDGAAATTERELGARLRRLVG
jgi:hypothetical protein